MEKKRKKWEGKDNHTLADIKFNQKRKWQLALRRYVIERKPNYQYAPYFGLDINTFRNWIELQFTEGLTWDSFGTSWQFGHIIPVNYFDFEVEEDLKLCWSFINIQVETLDKEIEQKGKVDILSAKTYFNKLLNSTSFSQYDKMLAKIKQIEAAGEQPLDIKASFVNTKIEELNTLLTLSAEDFSRINEGEKLSDIILEQEMMKKFG
jgi:hypothetical protein